MRKSLEKGRATHDRLKSSGFKKGWPLPFRVVVLLFLPLAAAWNEWDGDSVQKGNASSVANLEELVQAFQKSGPGSRILLEAGDYGSTEQVILKGGSGTADAPILIQARRPGTVHFKTAGFTLEASSWVTLQGVIFDGPFAGKADKTAVQFSKAEFCRLTRCSILPDDRDESPLKAGTRYGFLQSGGGVSNRFDHNLVQGKRCMGPMIVIRPDEKSPLLDHNRFKDFARGKGNGYEGLQLGNDYRWRMRAVVRSNWFENLDGEPEVISIKTGENLIEGNVFLNCGGEVVVRAANGTRILGNLFWNRNGKKSCGGIRNQGDDTFIHGNDFIGTETGVQTQCGDKAVDMPDADFYDVDPNALEAAYRQSRRVKVVENRMIECVKPFYFKDADTFTGVMKGKKVAIDKNLHPEGWWVLSNRIQGGGTAVTGAGEMGFRWEGNVLAGSGDNGNLGRSFTAKEMGLEPRALFVKGADGSWQDASGKALAHPGVIYSKTGPD